VQRSNIALATKDILTMVFGKKVNPVEETRIRESSEDKILS